MRMLPLFLLLACSAKTPASAPIVRVAEPTPDAHPVWQPKVHMQDHFTFASDALRGILEGDLTRVHAQAEELTYHDTEQVPEGWAPHVEALILESRKLQDAGTEAEAATQLMAVAAACAACHQASGGPDVGLKALLADHTQFGEGAMQRHEWAAFRMWIGVIVPDAEIYAMGASGMALDEGGLPSFTDEVRPLHDAVIAGGKRALEATDEAERRAALAALLPTCAACHTKLGVTLD